MRRNDKSAWRAWAASVGTIALLPLVALPQLAGLPAAAGLAAAAVCAALALASATLADRARAAQRTLAADYDRLTEEVAALNEHTIVSVTDRDTLLCYANENFRKATGYSDADIMGKSPYDLYDDNPRELREEIQAFLAAAKPWFGETTIRCRDGSSIRTQTSIVPRVDVAGTWLGTVAVRTNITELRIAALEHDTILSLQKLAEPVIMFSPDTLFVVYMNDAALSLAGWADTGYDGRTVTDIGLGMDPGALHETLREIQHRSTDQGCLAVAAGAVPYEASIQLIAPKVGVPRFFAILRDVSARQAHEASKQEFVSTVSHELRAPLTAIKGAIGLILSGATGVMSDKARGMLEIAHRNADRLILIVNDILDLEGMTAGRMTFDLRTRDLRDVLTEAQVANAPYSGQYDVELGLHGLDAPALATFDFDRMLQVVTNLMSNATKFSPPGSEIAVTLGSDAQYHTIAVADRGAGIPAAAMATIFERFSQLSSSDRSRYGGTGLGLAIVKAIVERHRGTVHVDSTVGVGTTITVRLRRAVSDARPARLSVVGGNAAVLALPSGAATQPRRDKGTG